MAGIRTRGFTIIELLVVVSIIALLVGILLPAIGKAREQAQLTKSTANMRNLGTAYNTYEAEWNDRQFTMVNDNIGRYGDTPQSAFPNYHTAHGGCPGVGSVGCHPPCILGWSGGGLWGFWQNHPGNWVCVEPFRFPGMGGQSAFGAFRIQNARQFNQYLNGRFYDPVWYAPKDRVVIEFVDYALENPGEYTPSGTLGGYGWTSYCSSPAAMFSPDVLGKNPDTGLYYTNPFEKDAGLRSPVPRRPASRNSRPA